nr:HL01082p [Drosophila melanogaster]
MFGPSPDWVVGISGLDLCTEDCSWKESMDFDLFPWDAGTDSGISYMSPNSETQPPERMYRITTMYPEDPRAPFYNPKSREMTPLAKLYLRREKIVSRNCDDEFLQALQLEVSDDAEEQDTRAECRVGDYSAWSPCSVSCGKGIRMRSRQYLYPAAADQNKCARQLVAKEMCVAAIPECADGPAQSKDRDDDEGENLANSQSLVGSNGEGAGLCKTSPWSVWSECSASCGIGITMRTRTFVNHLGRKRCPHITIVEKNKCMRPDCTYEQVELPDPQCPTSQWSDWSPCSSTCGRGVTIRTRLLLLENGPDKESCTQRMELHQQKECVNPIDCHINAEQAKDICVQAPDPGPCRGTYMRYAYDPQNQHCYSFTYGGCRGNRNNFLTENDCLNTCNVLRSPYSSRVDQPRACVLSDWSVWSPCSVSCGVGVSESRRYVVTEPQNGGQPCSKRLVKSRSCAMPAC